MDTPSGKPVTRSYTQIAAIALLTIGCLYVLRPFMAAILFAACIAISSWPLYLRVLGNLNGRRNLAAATLTLTLILLIVLPITLVTYHLVDDVTRVYEQLRFAVDGGQIDPPVWLQRIPLVGDSIYNYLSELLHSRQKMIDLAQRMLEPARHYLLAGSIMLGTGVAQVSLAAFVSFFLYRDGDRLLRAIQVIGWRIIGANAAKVATTVSQTVRGVMYGLLGTALAQALVAAVGFLIAGVPAVPLLSFATFVMSLVPVGPPIIWGGATLWLFDQGRYGWGIFMLGWGLILISGVDNIVKPMLISRGSHLPFLLVLLGVLGGVLAFGFVGIFIGPTLLAVAYSLLREWTGAEPAAVVPD